MKKQKSLKSLVKNQLKNNITEYRAFFTPYFCKEGEKMDKDTIDKKLTYIIMQNNALLDMINSLYRMMSLLELIRL